MTVLETFNELFLLLSLYMLPLFTDWVTDPRIQYKYGWIFVYTIAPLFLVNIGVVIVMGASMIHRELKKWSAKRKLRLRKEAEIIEK